MSTYFIPFFFPLRLSPKINSHPAHQLRIRNSLKLRFESRENRFSETGFLGKTAPCPAPEASGGRRGPARPSRRPHLPRLRCQRPLPPSARLETRSHPRASRPRRPHPAHTSRRGRAACGPRRGARGRELRRGPHEAENTGASPEPPQRPGQSLTYLRRISLPLWGSTWPGRARPRGRGDRATARRGRPRARLWRTASRGGGGQAARGSGRRIPHRPSGMPPPPRLDREAPRAARQSWSTRVRARHLSVPAALAPPLRPSQLRCSAPGAAAVRLASAGSQDARACAAPRRAGARAARARAARARARAPTRRRRRAPAEGNPREAIGRPGGVRTGSQAGLKPWVAPSSEGGGAGQVGCPRAPTGFEVQFLLHPEIASGEERARKRE